MDFDLVTSGGADAGATVGVDGAGTVVDEAGVSEAGAPDAAPVADGGSAPPPDAGTPIVVTELAVGGNHTCVLLSDGSVRCWGENSHGQLGYGYTHAVSDPAAAGPVSVTTTPGVAVAHLWAGYNHTCALLTDRSLKCWGWNANGQLGYGRAGDIGDDELPSSVGAVQVTASPGLAVTQIAAGYFHTCALLSDGSVKCWGGANFLGYGTTSNIGDDETPATVGPVQVTTTPGLTVTHLAVGLTHTCAVLSDGSVRCWGESSEGQLGYGNSDSVGSIALPSSAGPVSITTGAATTVDLTAGALHTCVRLSDTSIKCWGYGAKGSLGYGNTDDIGDDELPSSVGPVHVVSAPGVTVRTLATGGYHACVILSNETVQCWGMGDRGQLGYGNTANIGDDELPSSVGAVHVTSLAGVTVRALALGQQHSCALLSNGAVQCWGDNHYGQLGSGSTTGVGDNLLPSSSPPVSLF
jgi:alpha-tubulin suppressor-like RCC1 family protein